MLLRFLLGIKHWRQHDPERLAIPRIQAQIAKICSRKTGPVAGIDQEIRDNSSRIGVERVGAAERKKAVYLEREVWQGGRVAHCIIVGHNIGGPRIAEGLVSVARLPIRIRRLTVAPEIDCRWQRRQRTDVLVPPHRANSGNRTLAHAHDDRSAIVVLLTAALASAATLALAPLARSGCRLKV